MTWSRIDLHRIYKESPDHRERTWAWLMLKARGLLLPEPRR